jgi:hypothetical protein
MFAQSINIEQLITSEFNNEVNVEPLFQPFIIEWTIILKFCPLTFSTNHRPGKFKTFLVHGGRTKTVQGIIKIVFVLKSY